MCLKRSFLSQMMLNQAGVMLVQTLVSMGIMSILCLVFITMLSSQQRETQALSEKLSTLELQQQLIKNLADGTVCTSLLSGVTFDSTQAVPTSPNKPSLILSQTSIPISTAPLAPPFVTAGEQISPLSASVVVSATSPFRVTDIVGTSTAGIGLFTGYFQIEYDQSRMVRPLKPARTLIWIETTSSGTTQTITGCSGGSPGKAIAKVNVTGNWVLNANGAYYATGVATCPGGYVATGGGAFCDADTGYASLIYSNPTVSGKAYYASCVNWGPGVAGTSASGYGINVTVLCLPQ